MKNPKKIEQYVRDNIAEWQFQLGLGHYNLDLQFGKVGHPDPDKVAGAECSSLWEYKEIKIKVDAEQLAKDGASKRYIQSTIAHELFHVKTGLPWEVTKKIINMLVDLLDERITADLEHMPLVQNHIAELLAREASDSK